ncbi:hypothetical protein H2509_19375 [Stappia sp. F7233]|uniref:Flagellar motility protein MotE, a chaperone for MotC folding n=1 Tax=Stappia albiluteola TaxID=2758565 RepID=A0A839AKH2_9HYPH|nr:hypothetical protein [Stappia albiluteola]
MAVGALCALKLIGLVVDGGYVALPVQQAVAQQADAGGPAQAAAKAKRTEPEKAGDSSGGALPPSFDADADGPPSTLEIGGSSAERKVLESLGDRRRELDDREKKFDLREQLLKATEERVQERLKKLAEAEARLKAAETAKQKKAKEELQSLVIMYESMKAKDAARIFDRLDLDILMRVAGQMKPRKMADVLARMAPEAAERLTVALANGTQRQVDAPLSDELPKIQGN